MRLRTVILTAALATAAFPAAASADTLLAETPEGSQNLTANGGYMAWVQPNQPAGSGFRVVVRAPDGAVSTPDIEPFESVPTLSIGSDQSAVPRALLLTYARDGDVYSYDLRQERESKVVPISSGAEERSPIVEYGTYTFVRASGSRPGVYQWSVRRGLKRILAYVPRELASNGSRIAYPRGNSVIVRRASGEGRPFVIRTTGRPKSIVMTRYAAAWIVGDDVFRTPRFGGSGPKRAVSTANRGARDLPAGTNSIAMRGGRVQLVLDSEGVKRLNPTPFGSRG